MRASSLWLWLSAISLSLVLAQTTKLDLATSMSKYWDSLAGGMVSIIGPFTEVQIRYRSASSSICNSAPFPFPEETTHGHDMQEWPLRAASKAIDLFSTAIRYNGSQQTMEARCGTELITWCGSQTRASTIVSTTSLTHSKTPQAKLFITAGLSPTRPTDDDIAATLASPGSTSMPTSVPMTCPTERSMANANKSPAFARLEQTDAPTNMSTGPVTRSNAGGPKGLSTDKIITISAVCGGTFFVALAILLWHFTKDRQRLSDSVTNSPIIPASGNGSFDSRFPLQN